MIAQIALTEQQGFNRTFMELKLMSHPHPIGQGMSFNRTFMELK